MRDFLLSEEDRAFRAEARALLARELAPRAAAIEDEQDWAAV
jgi:alkylation response protein AidB-like acyl-CoA dehydrogenase